MYLHLEINDSRKYDKIVNVILYLFNMLLVCKILAEELENRLQETGKTSEYLEIGYSIDLPKKKKEYKKS